jgi:hypothetical protein
MKFSLIESRWAMLRPNRGTGNRTRPKSLSVNRRQLRIEVGAYGKIGGYPVNAACVFRHLGKHDCGAYSRRDKGGVMRAIRKTGIRKTAARLASAGARRHTKIAELRHNRSKDRAAAKSGVPKARGARAAPAATGDAASEFPDAIYQDGQRNQDRHRT